MGALTSSSTRCNKHTLFPVSLFEEVLGILTARQVEFGLYGDLCMSGSLSTPRWRYVGEYTRWKTGGLDPIRLAWAAGLLMMTRMPSPAARKLARRLDRKRDAPIVFLQHDADRHPFRTYDVMDVERQFGVRSSSYFFYESPYDDNEPYELDVTRMQAFENDGWEIGYHQNAYELAAYDAARTPPILSRDVAWFQERFDLRSYTPHGPRNCKWPHGGPLDDLICAFNGPCILKEFTWSDGGCEYGAVPSDPRVFARELPSGCRATMLMHPQYYGESPRPDVEILPICKVEWWQRLWSQ
jgi:hypothetical protein